MTRLLLLLSALAAVFLYLIVRGADGRDDPYEQDWGWERE